jgi:hypothetical protein
MTFAGITEATGRLTNSKGRIVMVTSITRQVSMIFAMTIAVAAWAGSGIAQETAGGGPVVIHRGNTDIIFESAGTKGLSQADYQAFDQFGLEHPEIVKALERNPRLINDKSFIKSQAPFANFLHTHPGVVADFAENPGNYVDMPVAVAASIKKRPITSP